MKNTNFIISAGLDSEDTDDRAEAGSDVELRKLVFGEEQHGLRLDRALVEMVSEFSRSYLQQLIELGGVTVNKIVVSKASVRVKAGDTGVIELRPGHPLLFAGLATLSALLVTLWRGKGDLMPWGVAAGLALAVQAIGLGQPWPVLAGALGGSAAGAWRDLRA